MEGAAELLSGLFISPRTPGTHWALPCLGHLWAASGPALGAVAELSAFPGQGTCSPVPSLLLKALTDAAPP